MSSFDDVNQVKTHKINERRNLKDFEKFKFRDDFCGKCFSKFVF